MFKEFTIVNPETQTEVMVDINTELGKIDGLYCYKDDIPVIENYETEKVYKVSVREGKNPLFVHIKRRKYTFGLLLIHGWIFALNEEDSEYEADIILIEKSLTFNGIGTLNSVY